MTPTPVVAFEEIKVTYQTISNAATDTTGWLKNFILGGDYAETGRTATTVTFTDSSGQFIRFNGTALDASTPLVQGFELGSGSATKVTASFDKPVGFSGAFGPSTARSLCNNEVVNGLANFNGGNKADIFVGAGKDDVFTGKGGKDGFQGRNGSDIGLGGGGKDHLEGQNGRDILKGGKGLDIIVAGNGHDKVWGGANEDMFIFDTSDGRNILRDFSAEDYLLVTSATGGSGFWLAEDLVGSGTLADLTPTDQVTLGLTVSEAGGHTKVVMSGGTTMVLRNTTAVSVGLDQLAFTDTDAAAGVGGLEAATGLDWNFINGWP